jgi:hypothetical protein
MCILCVFASRSPLPGHPGRFYSTLVHTLFLLWGDSEEPGGFHTSMGGVLQMLSERKMGPTQYKAECGFL